MNFRFTERKLGSVFLTLTFFFLVLPVLVFAQSPTAFSCLPSVSLPPTNFQAFVCLVLEFVNPLFAVLVAASLLVFIWGLAKFILAAGDEKKIKEGKKLIFWGIIALFVMISIWGIIQLVYSDVFGGSIGIPQLKTS